MQGPGKVLINWIKENNMVRLIIGIVIGAALGFSYYRFVGCSNGTCPITSNPYISTLYGALIGAMLAHSG
jgi:hypothetical protein